MLIDLNADLGEGMPGEEELTRLITSANVNCGYHAADFATVQATVRLVAERGLRLGAHPGHADREHFGRRELPLNDAEIRMLIQEQVSSLARVAAEWNLALSYIKPHGALYHQACRDEGFAIPLARAAADFGLPLVALPNSRLEFAAAAAGVPFVREGYLDRRYLSDGTLVPRSRSDALLDDPAAAAEQAKWLIDRWQVRTLCVHGDTPGAVALVGAVRELLRQRGFNFRAFT